MREIAQIRSRFSEFEEFQQIVLGWGLDFSQLDCGPFFGRFHQVASPDVLITECLFNRKLLQRGQTPEGMYTFGLLTEDSPPCIWRKAEMNATSLVVFPQDGELEASSLASFHCYALSVSTPLMRNKLEDEGRSDLVDKLDKGGVLRCGQQEISSLRSFLLRLTTRLQEKAGSICLQSFRVLYTDELCRHILNVVDSSEAPAMGLSAQKRIQLIRDIECSLLSDTNETLSVSGLCATFQVSERTLQRLFLTNYGVSPKQFIQSIRLNKVRKNLLQGRASDTAVSKVINDWGFWHMGHFAQIYRRQFGELPSETLERQI